MTRYQVVWYDDWADGLICDCGAEPEPGKVCNCMIPYLEGAGQHSPGCSVFDVPVDTDVR